MVGQAHPSNVVVRRTKLNSEEGLLDSPKKGQVEKFSPLKPLPTLSLKEKIMFELIQMSPILVVYGILHSTHDFLLTLIIFHILLIWLPFQLLKSKGLKLNLSLQDEMTKLRKNKDSLIWFLMIPSIGLLVGYLIMKKLFLENISTGMNLPDFTSLCYGILLAIDFIILNPFIEEVFWRIFCHMFVDEYGLKGKINVALHFALYHFFVIHFISQNALIALICAFGIFGLGLLLTITNQIFGLFHAIVFHFGVDLVAGIAIMDLKFNFLNIL